MGGGWEQPTTTSSRADVEGCHYNTHFEELAIEMDLDCCLFCFATSKQVCVCRGGEGWILPGGKSDGCGQGGSYESCAHAVVCLWTISEKGVMYFSGLALVGPDCKQHGFQKYCEAKCFCHEENLVCKLVLDMW